MKYRSTLERLSDYHPGKRIPGSLKLSSNENPLGPCPASMKAAAEAMATIHIYPPIVDEELRMAIANFRGVKPEQVVTGNGSDEVFSMIGHILLEPGTNAIGSAHTFSQYKFDTLVSGADYREIPMKGLSMDLDAMLAAVDENTRVLFICTPNNPTGETISDDKLVEIAQKLREDVLLVIDGAYRDYVEDPGYLNMERLLAARTNIIVTGTFSKIFGLAALRFGYGVSSEEIITSLMKVKQPFNNSNIAIAAAKAALDDADFFETSRKFNSDNRSYVMKKLHAAGISVETSEANFICIESPNGSAADAVAAIQDRGITVRNLSSFGLPAYIRVTIADAEHMDTVVEALEGIKP